MVKNRPNFNMVWPIYFFQSKMGQMSLIIYNGNPCFPIFYGGWEISNMRFSVSNLSYQIINLWFLSTCANKVCFGSWQFICEVARLHNLNVPVHSNLTSIWSAFIHYFTVVLHSGDYIHLFYSFIFLQFFKITIQLMWFASGKSMFA